MGGLRTFKIKNLLLLQLQWEVVVVVKTKICGNQDQNLTQNSQTKHNTKHSGLGLSESLFTFLASLAYVPFFLLKLQNRLLQILKKLHKISFV